MRVQVVRYLVGLSWRYLRVHLRHPYRSRWFPEYVYGPLWDAARAVFARYEDLRALGSAWGGRRFMEGLVPAYDGPIEGDCWCVECLAPVPEDYFTAHEGRCWYCEHIEHHTSPKVLDYYHSMYQERY